MQRINQFYFLILLFIIGMCGQLDAQKKATVGSSLSPMDLKVKVYKQALGYADLSTATTAVHEIMALQPSAKNWRDTLALLYLNQQAFYSSATVAKEALTENPENIFMREISAYSFQGLGALKQALEDYEKLYAKSQNIQHLYQMATLEYNLGRVAECALSLEKVNTHKDADQSKVSLTYGNQQQQVPIKAAVMNMKGVLAKDLNKNDEAMKLFDEAVKLFPDFALAKGNIEALKNPKKK